jgi:hypothetical protein
MLFQGKVHLSLELWLIHADEWQRGGLLPSILNFGTNLRLVVGFTPRLLYPPWKDLRCPIDRRQGEPTIRSGCRDEGQQLLLTQPVACHHTSHLTGSLVVSSTTGVFCYHFTRVTQVLPALLVSALHPYPDKRVRVGTQALCTAPAHLCLFYFIMLQYSTTTSYMLLCSSYLVFMY